MKKIILLCLLTTGFVQASDGVFAINDVCDGFGCFPGDSSGLPITITQSGSYQLTSNIVSSSTTINAIEISANNVTLDLNGFAVLGPRTCSGSNTTLACTHSGMTANGVGTSIGRFNIVVKNGVVKGFDSGIAFEGAGRNISVSHITAEENSFGIALNGTGIISDCIANRNLSAGLVGGFSVVLINDTMALGNKDGPILIGGGICSNVLFHSNGAINNVCARYTNESTCEGLVACP